MKKLGMILILLAPLGCASEPASDATSTDASAAADTQTKVVTIAVPGMT